MNRIAAWLECVVRRSGRIAAGAGVVVLALVFTAGPALAHNVLVSSSPANGATLDTAPTEVSFTFDQPVKNFDPALKVFGPNGNEFTTAAPSVLGNTVSAPMDAGPAGAYRAVFRVVSADGHPVTGEITFNLSDAAAGTASGAPTTGVDAGADSGETNALAPGGVAVWVWVLIGVAVVAIAGAVVLAVRKPRRR